MTCSVWYRAWEPHPAPLTVPTYRGQCQSTSFMLIDVTRQQQPFIHDNSAEHIHSFPASVFLWLSLIDFLQYSP